MDYVELNMDFSWTYVGFVDLDEFNKVKFPTVGNQPGLYRFDIKSSDYCTQYIGETERLSRRLQHYRTPGPSQQTNLRLNALLVAHIRRGDNVSLSVVVDGVNIICAGCKRSVDFSVKSERILLESAAILNARASGVPILNL